MKSLKKSIFPCLICVLLGISLMLGFFAFEHKNFALAEEEFEQGEQSPVIDPVSDNYFSLAIQASPRENEVVSYEMREITDAAGMSHTYICFKWSEIELIRFVINFTNTKQDLRFNTYSLSETYTVTDDMQTPLVPQPGATPTQTPLFSNRQILQDSIVNNYFYYYVDSTAPVEKTDTTSAGKDFGLYKFVLSYNYSQTTPANPVGQETNKDLELYIAILPTEITEDLAVEIKKDDIQILYSVTNQNLMNKFNFWLSSNNSLRFINPYYIKWTVTGRDSKNNPYVLDDNQRGDSGERTVYDASPVPPYGQNFEFFSNGIEGSWNVGCEIQDKDGNVLFSKEVKNLSTYKVKKPFNYLWLILIISMALILIIIISLLIYYIKKKREHVW